MIHDLGNLPGYGFCSAEAINDAGVVVGFCSHKSVPISEQLPTRGFVWRKNRNGGEPVMLANPPSR